MEVMNKNYYNSICVNYLFSLKELHICLVSKILILVQSKFHRYVRDVAIASYYTTFVSLKNR